MAKRLIARRRASIIFMILAATLLLLLFSTNGFLLHRPATTTSNPKPLPSDHDGLMRSALADSDKDILTLPEAKSLAHWSLFGRDGASSRNRTLASAWKHKPFIKPQSAAWRLRLSASDFGKLLLGRRPRSMDDHWFVYAEGPDEEGVAKVHFHRSWTGKKKVELEIVVRKGGSGSVREDVELEEGDAMPTSGEWVAEIRSLTWETSSEAVNSLWASKARVQALLLKLCNGAMGMKLVDEIKESQTWNDFPLAKPPKVGGRGTRGVKS